MKLKRGQFPELDDDWIHTEVLGQRKKGGRSFSNCVMLLILAFVVALIVIAFQGMFRKSDLSNLENLDKLKKQAEEQAAQGTTNTAITAETEDVVYKVKPGDTLAAIGAEFAVEWQKIAEKNNLNEPYALEVDQELTIPGVKKQAAEEPKKEETSAGPAAAEGTEYIVKEGDTLAGIGLQLGISWEKIAEANKIEAPYPLSVGQKLIIPKQ